MRNKIIIRCIDIINQIIATQNIGGISYVEEALRIEKEKNDFRQFGRQMTIDENKKKLKEGDK